MATAIKLYQCFSRVAEVVHVIRLEYVVIVACVFQLALTPHIIERATQ